MKMREESEKVGLKLNIQKTKIMASGPMTSWQIVGETVEPMADFILGGSRITADGECSHEIKRRLLLGRKVMANLDSILKTEPLLCNNGPSSQGYVFPSSHVWMWELDYKESWVPKNWCSWIVALEKTLESPMDCRTPGLSIPHHLLEFAQVHVHWINDAIHLSHPLSPPSPLPSVFPIIKVISSELVLHIRWPK